MRVKQVDGVATSPVDMEGAVGVTKRVLVGPEDGAPRFIMRAFDVEPGGETPCHSHPSEHEVYVLSGRGTVLDGGTPREIGPGSVVWVAPGDVHQFRADRGEPLRFLCVIPHPDTLSEG